MIECDGAKSTEEHVSARVFIHFNSEAMTGRVIIYLQSERNVNQKHAKRKKKKRSDHSCCSWVVTSELHQLYILGPQVTTFICDDGDGLYPPPCTSVWMSPAVLASVSHQFDSQCDHNLPNDHYRR